MGKYIICFETFMINEARVPRDERHQLYKDENIIVVVPLTHRALRKYAHGCKWCINDDEDEWEEYHKNKHVVIIQRIKKEDNIGITGFSTSEEIFYINKYNNDESSFEDVCEFLDYDFDSKDEMLDYYSDLIKDINNFSTNIVYYSEYVYDMGDNNLGEFNFKITDIRNITDEVIKIIEDYLNENL